MNGCFLLRVSVRSAKKNATMLSFPNLERSKTHTHTQVMKKAPLLRICDVFYCIELALHFKSSDIVVHMVHTKNSFILERENSAHPFLATIYQLMMPFTLATRDLRVSTLTSAFCRDGALRRARLPVGPTIPFGPKNASVSSSNSSFIWVMYFQSIEELVFSFYALQFSLIRNSPTVTNTKPLVSKAVP